MDLSFLGEISNYIDMDNNKIYEIRIRKSFPIKVIFDNKICYLTKKGLSLSKNESIYCDENLIYNIISNVTENSIYAFNDRIKEGFLTTKDGIRIGLAGECVFEGEKIITVKNINSINIRFPHLIKNCSDKLFNIIYSNNMFYNSLIISPPRYGKTTLLKDLIYKINNINLYNILVIDERGEFSKIDGENIDIIKYSNKKYCLEKAIRVMSPDIIITDELINNSDFESVNYSINCGVNVIASCHGKSVEDIKRKFNGYLNCFDRYIVLDSKNVVGIVLAVYDREFNKI